MAVPTAVAPSRMVTVAPASATSTVPVMVWLAWLVGTAGAGDRHHRRRGVQREAQRGRAGVAERIGLARHDGVRTVGQAARRERPCPLRVGGHRGRDRAAVNREMHHGAGQAGAAQRIIGVMWSRRRRPGIERQALGHRRTGGAQRIDHRAAGAGVAGGIGDLGGQRVAAAAERDRLLLQLPLLCTMAVPTAVAPSRMVTVAPASATSTVPVMVWRPGWSDRRRW